MRTVIADILAWLRFWRREDIGLREYQREMNLREFRQAMRTWG